MLIKLKDESQNIEVDENQRIPDVDTSLEVDDDFAANLKKTCTDDHENAGIYSFIQKILPNAVVCIILVFVLYLIRMKKAEKK